MNENDYQTQHARAVARERALQARHMAAFLESVKAPADEISTALEEESYWCGAYDRGELDS